MTFRQSKALNSGRAVLILGVVIYHTARVFDNSPFYVKVSEPLSSFAPVVLFGSLVGMPLFFSFAGYSIWHSLATRETRTFVRERVLRLLIPFILGLVLLVPLQIFVERRLSGESVSYLQAMGDFFDVHLTAQFPLPVTGVWFDPAHLWFLGYLFAFTLMVLPVLVWLRRRPALPTVSTRRGAVAIWLAAALGVAGAEMLLGTEAYGGWNRWSYLVFLALGICVATQPQVARVAVRRWRLTFVVAMASFAALAISCQALHGQFSESLTSGSSLAPMLWRGGKSLTVILILIAVVGSVVDYRPATRRSQRSAAVSSYLESVALPLYIVHQSMLVVVAAWVVRWSVPISLQWIALVVLTIGLSLVFIELAARARFGRLMLGIKQGRHTPVAAPAGLRPEGAPELGAPQPS